MISKRSADGLLLDRRILERNLRHGLLSQAELAQHLAKLTDVSHLIAEPALEDEDDEDDDDTAEDA